MAIEVTEGTRVHVSTLSNTQLDELLDRHVFRQDPRCHEACRLRYMRGQVAIYQCSCGALEERTFTQHIFGTNGHRRLVPRYTESRASAQQIFDAIRDLGKNTQICFTLDLCSYCPALASMATWLLFDATPRQIAVAALQSVDCVDKQGYLCE